MTRIAVLKPHHGPVGGFERVVNRVEAILEDAGHDVTRYTVDLTGVDALVRSSPLERRIVDSQREFLTYLHGRDAFDGISTGVYDLVISTSPPSYVHRHPAHLALFFHHHRVFYDLEDLYIAAGFPADPDTHAHAARTVRELDRDRFDAVTTFLCPSTTVARRLDHFNGRTDTLPFHAGVGVVGRTSATSARTSGALCVTRHEFPKRVELLVAAAHLVDPAIPVTCTGTGGRAPFARDLDVRLSAGDLAVEQLDDRSTWCNTGAVDHPVDVVPGDTPVGRVDFVGHVTDQRLDAMYAGARCVVAPAYDEDYGLTAIEAMSHGRPVIVCDDGGGLAELVEDRVTGLVVAPTPTAIAAAITELHDDPDLAARLGDNGRDRAAATTWTAAAHQLLEAVEATLDRAA